MKVILAAINAKYIHTNLAVRSLMEYLQRVSHRKAEVCEFTINQQMDEILAQIYLKKPDLLGFSCYLWNIEMIIKLSVELKKLLPHLKILCGGPEVSYNAQDFIKQNPAVDFVLCGEGEVAFSKLLDCLERQGDLREVAGLCFKYGEEICSVPITEQVDLSCLRQPYDLEDSSLSHRILYYETSRGCPFGCSYCLSSAHKGVRFKPLPQVLQELQSFLDHRVMQVKLTDRTFNCNKAYAHAIWRYLISHDNGVTNFHFEVAADLLTQECLKIISASRKGLFQLEIGVQSTCPDALDAISRSNSFEAMKENISQLLAAGNVHIHMDLIAGLPLEDYASQARSFNDVYVLHPHKLQLGFLKLLKGSRLYDEADKFGIVCRDYAPYEVLFTDVLSYEQLLQFKRIENLVELYYCSDAFQSSLSFLIGFFETPFAFYESLAEFWQANALYDLNHSRLSLYEQLFLFGKSMIPKQSARLADLLTHDMFCHKKEKKLPDFTPSEPTQSAKSLIYQFYDNRDNIERYLPELLSYDTKQIYRMAHIQVYDHDVLNGGTTPKTTAVLYNYWEPDILNHARTWEVKLK